MKKYILPALALAVLLVAYFLRDSAHYYKTTGKAQGTTYSVIYRAPAGADLSDTIQKILDHFDLSLSSYNPNSIISAINNNHPDIQTDRLFNTVFKKAREIYELSDGAFDITVAPLVNALGFGWKKGSFPDQAAIDSILEFVGMDKVELQNNKVIKSDPRVQLDVNAIAQGYSVDVIVEFLEKRGIKDYLVEVGGEVRCKGKNQNNKYWKIGIERPTENNDVYNIPLHATVQLKNKSLATSGNYRKFFEQDGQKFVHTIDPKTGKTAKSNLLSASVVADDCITADALATTFMVLGLDKSQYLATSLTGVETYLIYAGPDGEFKVWATDGFEKMVEEIN